MLKRITLLISAVLCLGSVTLTSVSEADEKAALKQGDEKALNAGNNGEKIKLEQKNPLGTKPPKAHGDPHVNEAPVSTKEPKVDIIKK